MAKNEFDSDFDFEKEYGFSLETIMGSDDDEDEDELLTEEADTASDEEDLEEDSNEELSQGEADDIFDDADADITSEGSEELSVGEDFDLSSLADLGLDDAVGEDGNDFDLDALSLELGEESSAEDMPIEEQLDDLKLPAMPQDTDEASMDLEEEDRPAPKKKRSLLSRLGFGRPEPKERRVRPRIEYDPEDIPSEEQPSVQEEPDFSFAEPEVPEAEEIPSAPVPDPADEELQPDVQVRNVSTETVGAPARPRRRKKRSKMRIFKDVYLPPLIAGVALILMLTFVIGSVSRAVQRGKNQAENDKNAADASMNEAARLQEEAQTLLNEAAALAAVYDYEGAIEKLDSFSGDLSGFTDLVNKRQDYAMAHDSMVEWIDPSAIPNLSFHVLIADPGRAFSDTENGAAYNMNFVTTDEFSDILEQLYANNYVLVDMDCFVEATTGEDGRTTYAAKPLYLPEGKKPIMITETLVNYFGYMIDGNDDGTPDASGAGFASRLVLDANGNVTAEMVDASGSTVTGDYDLVPILNRFIDEHDGFSYRGAKATLAVCGYEGIFGYRIQKSVLSSKGQDYYNEQVNGAKAVLQALRNDGYTIACYTYNNISYGDYSATDIQADLLKWNDEITPVIGDVDVLVYARSSDISDTSTPYSGSKFNVLYSAGFRYFIGSSEREPFAEISSDHVRQTRLQVTGLQMSTKPAIYASYFDAASVLNDQRGAQ